MSPSALAVAVDLDALLAPATREEIAAVWDAFPKEFRADRFQLLGPPIVRHGVAAQWLEYYSEGLKVYGQLYRPADLSRGPFPLLLHNHGAVKGIGPISVHQEDAVLPAPPDSWAMAGLGYVVLVSGYRGERTPLGFSDGEIELAKGEVNDVLNLLECGKTLPYVDSSRIGMWGGSHGGWITALAAQRLADLRGGVCRGTPAELCFRGQGPRGTMRAWVECLVAGRPIEPEPHPGPETVLRRIFRPLLEGRISVAQARHEMIARTPSLFAEHTNCPLSLAVGTEDDLYEHTLLFDAALARAGKEHEFRVFPGEGHGLSSLAGRQAFGDLVVDFLARRLR
ncbi:MAG: prolyl oligopeptidase family serine peptidase [Chloroflexi bacterium]|nr:prolyl oligopeptidase family serine peptidase [Chloroflexota bacterium]